MKELQSTANNAFPLRMAGEGETVRIVSLSGGSNFHDKLAGMGLGLGCEVEVLQNRSTGQMIIGHEGTRLFLGGGMAQKIQVAPVDGGIE